MSSAYAGFLGAAVTILLIVAVLTARAIRDLKAHPVRVAAVVVALSGLFAGLPPLLHELRPEAPITIVAPEPPASALPDGSISGSAGPSPSATPPPVRSDAPSELPKTGTSPTTTGVRA